MSNRSWGIDRRDFTRGVAASVSGVGILYGTSPVGAQDETQMRIFDVVPAEHREVLAGIQPIEIGETMVVRGTLGEDLDSATVTVEAIDGPSPAELGSDTADIGSHEWVAELEVSERVEPGEYVIRADDGEHSDEVRVGILAEGTLEEGSRLQVGLSNEDRQTIQELQGQIQELLGQIESLEGELNEHEQSGDEEEARRVERQLSQVEEELSRKQQDLREFQQPPTIEDVSLEVALSDTNSPVEEGNSLQVVVEVTSNISGRDSTIPKRGSVEVEVHGVGSKSKTVSSSMEEVTFTIPTERGDSGSHEVTVSTNDDSDSTSVTIEEAGLAGNTDSSGGEDGIIGTTGMLLGGGGLIGTLLGAYLLKKRRGQASESSVRSSEGKKEKQRTRGGGERKTKADTASEKERVNKRIDERISESEELVSKARRAQERRDYDDAHNSCERATDLAKEAHKMAQAESPDRVDETGARLRQAKRIHDNIKDERNAYNQATAALERTEDEVDTATEVVDSNPDKAPRILDDIPDRLDNIEELINEHEFPEIQEKIDSLREKSENLLEDVKDSPVTEPVSGMVTPPPDISLEYSEIDKRETIGSGGNADVYRAEHDGETIAIKEPRMSGTLHTETVERFMEEAETWDRLDDHENIVSVIDYGSEPLPWMALEYMDAGDMTENADGMELDEQLWTAICVTKAVRHAHRRGVAHLDLKPENILFRETDDGHYDVPKVADWGLAKMLLEHSKSVEGMSPQYSAPEQFDEDEYGKPDDMTDVYQLGAVFYELFTGRPPFEGQPSKVMHNVLHEEVESPTEVNPDLPSELDEVLLKALEKKKEDRYETLVNLRDDLQELYQSI